MPLEIPRQMTIFSSFFSGDLHFLAYGRRSRPARQISELEHQNRLAHHGFLAYLHPALHGLHHRDHSGKSRASKCVASRSFLFLSHLRITPFACSFSEVVEGFETRRASGPFGRERQLQLRDRDAGLTRSPRTERRVVSLTSFLHSRCYLRPFQSIIISHVHRVYILFML